MATVVNKANPSNFRTSANTPDFPTADWLINPSGFPALHGSVPPKYWKLTVGGDDIEEMTAGEKTTVDDVIAAQLVTDTRGELTTAVDGTLPEGVDVRALIQLLNKRDNYLTNRIAELQSAMDAMKATTGNAQNTRDAIPSSWLATNTRVLADAIDDYQADINAGVADG